MWKKCRNEYFVSVSPTKEIAKIDVDCGICHKVFEVHPSKHKKQDNFFCSQECYAIYRSQNFYGDKIYNYQDLFVPCTICKEEVKTSKWYLENKQHQFCSPECYWIHRKSFYLEFYYDSSLNNSRQETKPERLVREWLDNHKIRYIQEAGFLKKYFVDFYLPDYAKIIEVFGDYWHVNPDIYDRYGNNKMKKILSNQQKQILQNTNDDKRIDELTSYGYEVFVLWETDVYQNLDEVMRDIFLQIYEESKYE